MGCISPDLESGNGLVVKVFSRKELCPSMRAAPKTNLKIKRKEAIKCHNDRFFIFLKARDEKTYLFYIYPQNAHLCLNLREIKW